MSPLNVAICTTISYTLWVEWYYLKTIIWHWGQRSRSHKGHYGMRHIALWSCTHIPNIIDLSRKTKMLWPGQENTIYKTIIWPWGQRSRPRSLWYATHRLMVMHPHTKYNWPIWKDKKVMVQTSFADKKQKKKRKKKSD